jgi:hypothetical protein
MIKIKPILLSSVFMLGVSLPVRADFNPLMLVHDILGIVIQNTQMHDIMWSGCCGEKKWGRSIPEDSFHRNVIYYDGYEFSKGAPPPEAYVKVVYPGPAPKYLYQNRSISVHDLGDHHVVTYRRAGW